MRKRLLSILICLCMLLSMLPVSSLAAVFRTEEEEELYLRMLNLGLVDANGSLIEDNSFTLEDGTELESLDALVEWLCDCEESDHSTMITVDATGNSATAEQMAQALYLEYSMEDVAEQFNLLATGETETDEVAGLTPGQTVKNIAIEADFSGNIGIFTIRLLDASNVNMVAPCDIGIEVGLFASYLKDGNDVTASGSEAPGMNTYKSFTIAQGSSGLEFQIDVSKLRSATDTLGGRVWNGADEVLLQCRTTSGMRSCSASYRFGPVVGAQAYSAYQDIENPDVLGFLGATYCYSIITDTPEDNSYDIQITEETVNNTAVYKMKVWEFNGKGINTDTLFSPGSSRYKTVMEYGVGDASPSVTITDLWLFVQTDSSVTLPSTVDLYNDVDGALNKISTDNKVIVYDKLTDAQMTEFGDKIIELSLGDMYKDNEFLRQMAVDTLRDALKSGELKIVRFQEVKIPFSTTDDASGNKYSREFCLKTDWAGDTELKPTAIMCTGKMLLNDTTAPTVTSISVPKGVTWYPGEKVPITVTFSEPVYTGFKLYYQDGDSVASLNCVEDSYGNSKSKVVNFEYEVKDTDVGSFLIKGVGAANSSATDLYGNALLTTATTVAGDSYYAYDDDAEDKVEGLLLENIFGGCRVQDSIASVTAVSEETNPCAATVTVNLKNDEAYEQIWTTWYQTEEADRMPVYLVVDGDKSTTYTLTLKEETSSSTSLSKLYLTCELNITDLSVGKHVVELYLNGEVCYGAYAEFERYQVIDAPENAYVIQTPDPWPSGEQNVVYLLDQEATQFTATKNPDAEDYTFTASDQFYWASSDEKVFTLEIIKEKTGDAEVDSTASISPVATGEAELILWAKNGSEDTTKHTKAAASIKIKVLDGGSPGLVIPTNANTFFARQGESLHVSFSSNLGDHDPQDSLLKAELYDCSGNSLVWSTDLARNASYVEIPEGKLTKISSGDLAAYRLHISGTASIDGVSKDFETDAYIIVRAQPTVIMLTPSATELTSGKSITISWSLKNYDPANDGEFQLVVENGGSTVASTTDPGKATESGYSGSLEFTPTTPSDLKDYYVVTAKAQTNADPTWSTAAVTLTVYRPGALDLLVNGQSTDSVTLENKVSSSSTMANPSITNVNGKTSSGLTNAEAITKLRSELSLMTSIQVNCSSSQWSILDDAICWSTTTGSGAEIADELSRAVTVNYRRGTLYEPLEKLTYTCYMPQVVMMLCGLRNGTNTVTATHNAVADLSDSVTVNVSRLKDKLYLFQFTPTVKTEISYEDRLGVTHTVYSNGDGSLALFEPNGIASDLRMASQSGEEDYRGTVSAISLKSGEGNGTLGELYPLNSFELRLAATAQVQLLKPDGTALANTQVTLRGGVYRNAAMTDNRDDAYCENARFAKSAGAAADLDGKTDQTFTTDENGVLTVHMDLTQFTSKNDSSAVGVGDNLQFIFELRFANNQYYPEIVTVNGSLTRLDAMRSGENIVTLQTAEKVQPFVAVQTVDYYTGRQLDVRRHTGVVGPSSNYPEALLETTVMLWGIDMADAESYSISLRSQQNAISVPNQSEILSSNATYPFSSIAMVSNAAPLNSATFNNYQAEKKTPIEVVLSKNGTLQRTISLPFGLVDMNAVEKVEDSPSLLSLMANLAAYGKVGGADTDYDLVNTVSNGILNDALSTVVEVGSAVGLVRSVLLPTEDPTRFEGYLWTGLNTTSLEDLNYDEHGVAVEMSYFGQDYDSMLGEVCGSFTLSDFQAMADGSYFDDVSSLYGAAAGIMEIPIALQLEGWMTCEIRYNFDEGRWEVLTTGGGFTAAVQMEFEQEFKPKELPLVCTITIGGGVQIDFKTAVRYAQQLGLEWDDETANAVNDYLTALRINGYIEAFAGVGSDTGLSVTVGVFGSIELNNENRFLTRSYLKDSSQRNLSGQYLQLDGSLGIRAEIGVGPISTELTLFSVSISDQWRFNDWKDIVDYWESASSGLGSTGWMEGQPDSGTNGVLQVQNYSLLSANTAIVEAEQSVHLQSRDYLQTASRAWSSASGIMLTSVDAATAGTGTLQTNAYPFTTPQISDDGVLWVYVSDQSSSDVADTEVFYGVNYDQGEAIPDPEDFSGYGDSSLDFDGTSDHAGAIWLREAATLKIPAGSELNEDQQSLLLNGLEVVAAIWDGDEGTWKSTRLTNNGNQELLPVIAVNENGKAIAAWRVTQNADSLFSYDEEQILFKIYDGSSWSEETYTLYNGASGSVSGLDAEILPDGTAAIAYTLSESNGAYYAVLNMEDAAVEDHAKTIQACASNADSPALETVKLNGENVFVLGWHSTNSQTGATTHDVGLRAFNQTGAPLTGLPESLSQSVSTASFNGQFTFVKGAENLENLSILWNDSGAGEEDNDVLRAVKFCKFSDGYALSASIEATELPARTDVDSFDACNASSDGMSLQMVLQGTTYSDTEFETVSFNYSYLNEDGETVDCKGTGKIPEETAALYTASAVFQNDIEVESINVDYTTIAKESYIPVSFAVTNNGVSKLSSLTVNIGSGRSQTFDGLNLLPGSTTVLSAVYRTGSVIEDQPYTLTATFAERNSCTTSGTVYLDYPDVGISALQVTEEQEGIRAMVASLYNQSASSLNKNGRRVVLGVYSDPECETPLNGKYFADGISGQGYEVVINGSDQLDALDNVGFAREICFDIGQYVEDAGLTEIPSSGVTLFVKACIEEQKKGEWVTLPEADSANNQENITFESLLDRSGGENITTTVQMENNNTSSAEIQIRNNSLQTRAAGMVIATLVNTDGQALEIQRCNVSQLEGEAVGTMSFDFQHVGTQVIVNYGDVQSDNSSADAASISMSGLPLTMSCFDENGNAQVANAGPGSYLLTVIPAASGATVTVDGVAAPDGVTTVVMGLYDKTITIAITSPDGTKVHTYTVVLHSSSGLGGEGVAAYTIQASASQNGSISPAGTVSVHAGGNQVFAITPDTGYYIYNVLVDGRSVGAVESYTFKNVSANHTIEAVFAEGEADDLSFVDVPRGSYYEDAVRWAVESGITAGTDRFHFSPNDACTRAQAVTFLWRAAGSPAPESQTMPFADVPAGCYYYDAVLWAVENGITAGTSDTTFSPNANCSRAQIVTFLWRLLESPVAATQNPFNDVYAADYFENAVLWAVEENVTAGTTNVTFSPNENCTRAQIVTFIWRVFAE